MVNWFVFVGVYWSAAVVASHSDTVGTVQCDFESLPMTGWEVGCCWIAAAAEVERAMFVAVFHYFHSDCGSVRWWWW